MACGQVLVGWGLLVGSLVVVVFMRTPMAEPGDPLGDPEAWPGAIQAYLELSARHGWKPAVMGCSELGATVYQRIAGLSALGLGDEAVLRASDFGLDGRAMRGVRQACNRTARAGYAVSVRRVQDLTTAELDDVRVAADAWRTDGPERGFSMALSRLGDESDAHCVIATAHQSGRLRGLLHFVPWGADGLSLDLMRRDPESDNGLNELMISSVMTACLDLQVENVSLNFACSGMLSSGASESAQDRSCACGAGR
jgi:lysyl-tRNA synthetase, class II